jgi:hypothetical protein
VEKQATDVVQNNCCAFAGSLFLSKCLTAAIELEEETRPEELLNILSSMTVSSSYWSTTQEKMVQGKNVYFAERKRMLRQLALLVTEFELLQQKKAAASRKRKCTEGAGASAEGASAAGLA